jgi:hypothetical protein
MSDQFTGDPSPLSGSDYERAACKLGCPVAAVRAVAEVESRGGFLADGRPKILFERHVFHRLTEGRFGLVNPAISARAPGGYLGGAREYLRLAEAIALHREAALKAASWGAFQIMGFNHSLAGYADVESFVAAMVSGQGAQLDAFVAFLTTTGLDDALRRCDWAAFARAYNGKGYRANAYDARLARAFASWSFRAALPHRHRLLRVGDRGASVKLVQAALGVAPDGLFGPRTRAAVIKAQKRARLRPDGIVGPRTWAVLAPGA